MRKILPALVLSAAVFSSSAFAVKHDHGQTSSKKDHKSSSETMSSDDRAMTEDQAMSDEQGLGGIQYEERDQQAGTAGDTMGTTTGESDQVKRGMMRSEVIGIRPQIGAMGFRNPVTGDASARGAAGIGLDANLTHMFLGADRSADTPLRHVYLGASTGALVSHVGSQVPGSSFFGYNNGDTTNANLLIIPANLKVGYNFTDNFRLAAHGGGNVLYRSIGSTVNTGNNQGADDSWNLYPNVGGDIEFGLGQNVAVSFRPDMTITPGDDIYTGTVALAIPLG